MRENIRSLREHDERLRFLAVVYAPVVEQVLIEALVPFGVTNPSALECALRKLGDESEKDPTLMAQLQDLKEFLFPQDLRLMRCL